MSTLYIDRKGASLRRDATSLIVDVDGARPRALPLGLLERVVLCGKVACDTSVLAALAERGIAIALLSGRQQRDMAVIIGRPRPDASLRLAQYAAAKDDDVCRAWSARLIRAKCIRQHRMLEAWLCARPDRRRILTRGLQRLQTAVERLGEEPPPLATLLGLEGAAASAWFEAYSSLFAPALGFAGRNRRPPRDPVNAVLSLGYTLLHFEAVRACHAAGFDPFLGLYHQPVHGRESLAADLIEPLRPVVDRWVWTRFRDRTLRASDFHRQGAACLLAKAGRGRFYAAFEELMPPLRRFLRQALRTTARQLRTGGIGSSDWLSQP